MSAISSRITSVSIVYSVVCSGADEKKTSNLRVTGLCGGNSPVTDEFPAQMASSAENISIWWRHNAAGTHAMLCCKHGSRTLTSTKRRPAPSVFVYLGLQDHALFNIASQPGLILYYLICFAHQDISSWWKFPKLERVCIRDHSKHALSQ